MSPITLSLLLVIILGRYSAAPEKPLSNKSLTRYAGDKLLGNSKKSDHEPEKLITLRHENDVIKTIANRIPISKYNFNKHAEISNKSSFQSNPQTDWILQQSAQINRSHENSTGGMRRTRVHYFNELNTKPVKGNENSIKETQLENTNLLSENREIKRLSLSFTNEINHTVLDRVSRGLREDFKLKGETTVIGKTRGGLSRIKHFGAEFSPEILGENQKLQRNIHDNITDIKTVLKNVSLNPQSTNAKDTFVKQDLVQNNKDITDINNPLISVISKDLNYDIHSTTIKHDNESLIRDKNGKSPRDSNKFTKTELLQLFNPEFKNTKMETDVIESGKLQEDTDMVIEQVVDNKLHFEPNNNINVNAIETKIDLGDINLQQNMFQTREETEVKLVAAIQSRVTRDSEDRYKSEKKLKNLDEFDLVTVTSTTVKYSDDDFEEENAQQVSNHDAQSSFMEFQDNIFNGKRLLINYDTHFSQLTQLEEKATKMYNGENLDESIKKYLENLKLNQENIHVKDSQEIVDGIEKNNKFDLRNVRDVEIPRLRRSVPDVTKVANNIKTKSEELVTENDHGETYATTEQFNYVENITEMTSFEQTLSTYEVTTENKIPEGIDLLSKNPKEVNLSVTTTQGDYKKNDNLTLTSFNKNVFVEHVFEKELVSNIEAEKLNNTMETNVNKSEMNIENNTYGLFHDVTTVSAKNSKITNLNETSASGLFRMDNKLNTIKDAEDVIIRSNNFTTNIIPTAADAASNIENFKANENSFFRKLGENENGRQVLRQVFQNNLKKSGDNKIHKIYKTEGQIISNSLGNTLKSDDEKNNKLYIQNNKTRDLKTLKMSDGDENKISFGIVHIELNNTIVAKLSGKSNKTEKTEVDSFNGLQEKNDTLTASNNNLNLYPDSKVNETKINEKYAIKQPNIETNTISSENEYVNKTNNSKTRPQTEVTTSHPSKYYNFLVDKTKQNNPKIQINNKLVSKPSNNAANSHKLNNKNPLGNEEVPSRNIPATGYLNNSDDMEKSHELYFHDEILHNQPFDGFSKSQHNNLEMEESETVSVKAINQDDIIMGDPNKNKISSSENSANISPAIRLIKFGNSAPRQSDYSNANDLKFRTVSTDRADNKFEQNEDDPINKLTMKINVTSFGGEQYGLVNRDGLGIKRPMIKRSRSSIVPSVLSNENDSTILSTAASSLTSVRNTEPANSIRDSPIGSTTQPELPATTSQIPGNRSIAKSENSSTLFTTPSSVLPQLGNVTLETSLDSAPVPSKTNIDVFNITNLQELDYDPTEKNYTDFSDIFPSSPYTILLETTLSSINLTDNLSKQRLDATNASIKATEFPWPVKREAVVEGDIVLGGLMMVHEREDSVTCGPVMPQGGIQALEAMLYTLDMLNVGQDQLLPNITLGAHILDDCDKDTYGLEMAVDFIKGKFLIVIWIKFKAI